MKRAQLIAIAGMFAFAGCKESKFEGFEQAENGLYYRFFNRDEQGTKVQPGDGIKIRYVIRNQRNDSLIVDSKDVSRDGTGYTSFGLEKSSFRGSFEDGMMMMARGDSAEFIVPADSFYLKSMRYNELPPGIKPGDFLKGTFVVKDIMPAKEVAAERERQKAEQENQMKEFQAQEQPALEKYIADNNIKAKPSASGIYYIETKKGSGPTPKLNDTVVVNYTGKTLDGNVFDTNEGRGPARFALEEGRLIQGWIEAIPMMKKGGKATLVLPSALGYGPTGNGPIPPYAPLVFDVELIDVKPGAAPGGK